MSTSTVTTEQVMTEQDWFTAYQDTIIGQAFVGERTRLHVADLRVVAPHSLSVRILCGAGDHGTINVETTVRNVNLDASSEAACRSWWQQKVVMEADQMLEGILPGGLRRPRICGRCEAIRDENYLI